MIRLSRCLFLVVIALCAGTLLHAQTTTPTTPTTTTTTASPTGVLVYKLNFEHLSGFDLDDFYTGGYLVVPGVGGTGTVVLTGKNSIGGLTFSQFPNAAYFFQAKNHDTRYSVVQMTGGTIGTTSPLVGMQAFGQVHHSITIDTPTFSLRVQAASSLHGIAMASLDESLIPATITTTTPGSTTGTGTTTATTTTTVNPLRPTDGTLGYAVFDEMKLNLDTSKTDTANKAGHSVTDAVAAVVADLTLKGFQPLTTPTGGTGTGGTTTTPTGGTGTGGG